MVSGRSDGVLVAGVRGGDDAAFEELYDRYHRNLLAFCRHMLGSLEEAEDVLQQTFLAAYRALRGGDAVVAVKPWLYTIARNRCLSVLRARREEAPLDAAAVATEGLAAAVDRREDLRLLVRDVERLPPDQRAALVLFELGDHSHDEIAAILGVRRQKVKALVFQAREALMGWRAARDTPCEQVREQLATLTGSALRRATIRRHVEQCSGCTLYEAEVGRQRVALAIVLPVVPAAGLKAAVIGTALGSSGLAAAAGTGAAAGAAGLGVKGIAAKVLVVIAVVGGAGASGYVAVEEIQQPRAAPVTRVQDATPAIPGAAAAGATTIPATPPASPDGGTAVNKRSGAEANAQRGRGRALGTTVPHGKAAAPGQLKAPGSPAQGRALGRSDVKAHRGATAPAKLPPGRAKSKAPKATVNGSAANPSRAAIPAAQTASGQHPTGPGPLRNQGDALSKNP